MSRWAKELVRLQQSGYRIDNALRELSSAGATRKNLLDALKEIRKNAQA